MYYSTSKAGSYTGVVKFWQSIQGDGNPHKLKYKDIKEWLARQYTYSIHKHPIEKFKREPIIVGEINEIIDSDLMDMQKFSKKNNGIRFLAIFIDLFSRYLRVQPMKTKKGVEMAQVLEKVFNDIEPSVRSIRTDQGSEYKAKVVQEYFKSKNINHIITYNVYHANYAERVIRTLKGRIYRFFTKHQSHRYIDDLQDIVRGYNNTRHSSIGMSPAQVTLENQQELYEKLYLPVELKREQTTVVFRYEIGDKVRIPFSRRPFQRGFDQKWTEEIFLIDKRISSHPPRYRLVDLQLDTIGGSFYEQELQEANVDDDEVYKVEKILRHRIKDGERQGLVSWLGYPAKFNSWVDIDQIHNYE